jgi:hypothetical protein
VVALAALGVAIFAILRANKTTSAATLVTLNQACSQAWERYLHEPSDYNLGELLNLFEAGCAIYDEKSLTGNSRKLMRDYLDSVLPLLAKSQPVCDQAFNLLQSPETFIFIKGFLNERQVRLSVTIPPKWFQLPF